MMKMKTMLIGLVAALSATLATAGAYAATDVNKADQAALESIKGIGPSLSTKILDERKNGAYKDWSDLMVRVKGVGEHNAAKFSAEGLTVSGLEFTPSPAMAKAEKTSGGKTEHKTATH